MTDLTLMKAMRAPDKIRRELLRIPVFRQQAERSYLNRLKKYKPLIARAQYMDVPLVGGLQETGTAITSLQYLSLESTDRMLGEAAELVRYLKSSSMSHHSVVATPPAKLLNYPEVFLWGLEERLLDLIENYIGMPVIYHGFAAIRNLANGQSDDVRQWHIDAEDHRMVKIILYLNNVSDCGGPYEFIDRRFTDKILEGAHYKSGFMSDADIAKIVPRSDWNSCTGDYGTTVLSDTCSVFHRAKPPTGSDRFSLTFYYASIKPKTIRETWAYPPDHWAIISNRISDRQRICLTKQ